MKVQTRLHISVSDPQRKWLLAEAARLGLTISELIRRIIDTYRGAEEA